MLGNAKSFAIETLRQQITALETNPLLKDADASAVPSGLLATPRGSVHEVFADALIGSGAALGFALAQARSLIEPGRPAILFLQLQADALEMGLPYGLGLRSFGVDPQRLVLVRPQTIVELLWAIEEAIACRAVAAVVADIVHPHKALDFTASRRLSLRAAASGASVFMVRYARDREATAARYRWRIAPELSRSPPFDERAPGPPRWRVTLEKGSLGKRRKISPAGEEVLVDWTEDGFVAADDNSRSREIAGPPRVAALSHAAPAALGDRLSETG
jgi:protein ImuA